jgi:hypothetical protein
MELSDVHVHGQERTRGCIMSSTWGFHASRPAARPMIIITFGLMFASLWTWDIGVGHIQSATRVQKSAKHQQIF